MLGNLWRLCWRALFLQEDAYEEMRDTPGPFGRGLLFIILLGAIVAAVGVVGATLEWATTPNMAQLGQAVMQSWMQGPWVQEMPPEALSYVQQIFDTTFNVIKNFTPNPVMGLINIVLNPLGLVIAWLVYGLLAHLFARLLGGQGSLEQTYGCTALAVSPVALNVFKVLPYVQIGGLALWGTVCNYLAIKSAHQLSPARAFWATVLPFVVLFLLFIIVVLLGVLAFGAFFSNLVQGGIQ
jgi:hypothetical protein